MTAVHFAATGTHFGNVRGCLGCCGCFGFCSGGAGGGATRTLGIEVTGSSSDPNASRPSAAAVAVDAKTGAADDMRPTCSVDHKRGIFKIVTVRLLLTRRRGATSPGS